MKYGNRGKRSVSLLVLSTKPMVLKLTVYPRHLDCSWRATFSLQKACFNILVSFVALQDLNFACNFVAARYSRACEAMILRSVARGAG